MAEDLQRIKVKSVSSSKSAHLMNHAPSVEAASWTIFIRRMANIHQIRFKFR